MYKRILVGTYVSSYQTVNIECSYSHSGKTSDVDSDWFVLSILCAKAVEKYTQLTIQRKT